MVVAATVFCCCYDSFGDAGGTPPGEFPTQNTTIRELSEMLETERLIIYDDRVVWGYVTSTDENGNFYKTFLIENEGYALEVLEGLYDSFGRHNIGALVAIKLQGLALSTYREVLQVGLPSVEGSYYMLDYLTLEQVIDSHIFNNYTYNVVEPYEVTLSELSTDICGRLVKITGLEHTPAEDDLQPYVWEGYQQFVDNSDNSVYCYTSDYANFANLTIPQTTVSLCGILQYDAIYGVSGEQYILEMRGVYDCEE